MKLLATARESNPNLRILALDLPTGLNADTGEADPCTPFADLTVTLGFPKVGLFCFPGATRVGRLKIVDIGIPYELAEDIRLELLTDDWVRERLPRRPPDAHKGTFGHLLVVAGSRRYVGAACLASETAARVGAGLVTLAAPKGLHPIVATKLTEVIHLPLPEDDDGMLHPAAADLIKRELAAYNALLLGCGLGSSHNTQEFIKKLLVEEPRPPMPLVIDADGLNNLSGVKDWPKHLSPQTILTPHPGEMARLTGLKTEEIQKRRHETALEWAAGWKKVLVLKGAHTTIASPDGYCRISPFANPLLATAGTGDVLAGVIASLLAQGLTPANAACVGVYVHGLAAELLKPRFGTTGALASDVREAIPKAITSLSQNK
jgi:NAD(P)H-hydrate epimerase